MRLVCITGIDGSGKSTQIAALASALRERGLRVTAVSIWDGLTSDALRDRHWFRSREEVYRYLALLTPISRAYFLFHALRLSLDSAAEGRWDVVLLDGYWYKYFATEVAGGADAAAVRAMAAGFPEPDRTFYLQVATGEAAVRKREITDYERGFAGADRFAARQKDSLWSLEYLAAEMNWRVVDGSCDPKQITRELVAELVTEVASRER